MVLFTVLAVAVVIPVTSFVIAWFFCPATLYTLVAYKLRTYIYGLKVKYVSDAEGKFRYCYAERGEASDKDDSLVCLHGYSANKEMFLDMIGKLPKDIHIILLDLPGHGETSCPDVNEDVDMNIIMEGVNEFIKLVGLERYGLHLFGTSMGASVAMLYAGKYSDHVSRLTVMCPAMRTPIMTKFLEEAFDGINRLLPQTEDELQYMLDVCSYQKLKIPRQILKAILQLRKSNEDYWRKVFESLTGKEEEMMQLLQVRRNNLTMPSQVIWGKNDEVVHVSGAETVKEMLLNCERVDILDQCGHTCVLNRPGKVTKCLLEFRNQLPKKYQ